MTDRIDLQELIKEKGFTDVKLDIGSGLFRNPGFLSVDPFTESDISAMMWDLPIPDNSVDLIHCEHALEHVSKYKVVRTLAEWGRVLKIGGAVNLIVPDLEWTCAWWLAHQDRDWSMDILYGNQNHDGEYHRTGFTPTLLKGYIDAVPNLVVRSMSYRRGISENLAFTEENFTTMDVQAREILTDIVKINNQGL